MPSGRFYNPPRFRPNLLRGPMAHDSMGIDAAKGDDSILGLGIEISDRMHIAPEMPDVSPEL